MTARSAQCSRDDSGFSLIELIVASALSMIILLAVLSMLDSGTRSERAAQARQDATLKLRGALTQLTKDLRQAVSINNFTSTRTKLDMQTLIDGNPTQVVFDLSGTDFRVATAGGTPQVLVSNFDSTTTPLPFCYDPDPCEAPSPVGTPPTVRITLAATPVVFSGGDITLSTDVQLRNAANG